MHHNPKWQICAGCGFTGAGPDERNRFGEVSHIIIGIGKERGIDALGYQCAQHGGLHALQFEIARDCRQCQTAIRVGSSAEIVNKQTKLAVALRRQNQPVKKFSESTHQSPSSS